MTLEYSRAIRDCMASIENAPIKVGIFFRDKGHSPRLAPGISQLFSERNIIPQVGDYFSILTSDYHFLKEYGGKPLVYAKFRNLNLAGFDYSIYVENDEKAVYPEGY